VHGLVVRYNPLIAEWTPTTPKGNVVDFGAQDPQFERLESIGREAVRNAAFVLVAGGRGERLGYDGIKVHYVLCKDGYVVKDDSWFLLFVCCSTLFT